MQQNPKKLIINRIVIEDHEYQSMIGKLINVEYVANLQSCPKFLGNLEMKLLLVTSHLKKNYFSICGLTVVIQLHI